MPDLDFKITGVEPAARGLVPLLHFKLQVTNCAADEPIHNVLLQAQIQFRSGHRSYSSLEKEKLLDIFGKPEQWGQTLRNQLWAHAHVTVRSFSDVTEAVLPVPCTYDLNILAAKYFYALEQGTVPLLFLFSGTVFYVGADRRFQVQQISWEKECLYEMPGLLWQELMEFHYPRRAWIYLQRDLFDRLYSYKRRQGHGTFEQSISELLRQQPDCGSEPPVERPEQSNQTMVAP